MTNVSVNGVGSCGRLVVGTAQYSEIYRRDGATCLSLPDLNRLLDMAREADIWGVDTSPSYGEAHELLGRCDLRRLKVATKIGLIPTNLEDQELQYWLNQLLSSYLGTLKIERIDVLYLHDLNVLRHPQIHLIEDCLEQRRRLGDIVQLGLSCYDLSDLALAENPGLWSVIQAPVNPLDRRWLRNVNTPQSGQTRKLHARSLFLRGLLIGAASQNQWKALAHRGILLEWFRWCDSRSIKPGHAAISYVLKQSLVDAFIVGIENCAQLDEVIQWTTAPIHDEFELEYDPPKDLIDPRRW